MPTTEGTTEVIYQSRERVKIVKEHGLDYLIEDMATGKQYLIDKTYFHKAYASEAEQIPVHTEIWEKLESQAHQLHQLKRANSRLKSDNRDLRRQAEEARKRQKERQHYRNGQKRGKTRNG